MYMSQIHFIPFIPLYFMILDAILNATVNLILFFNCSLLFYVNTISLFISILSCNPAKLTPLCLEDSCRFLRIFNILRILKTKYFLGPGTWCLRIKTILLFHSNLCVSSFSLSFFLYFSSF